MSSTGTFLRRWIEGWRWPRAGLVVLSGVALVLALPPVSLWPLAWIGLVPLWWVVLATPQWGLAAAYGLLWGLVYYGLSLAWITHLHPLMWMAPSGRISSRLWVYCDSCKDRFANRPSPSTGAKVPSHRGTPACSTVRMIAAP